MKPIFPDVLKINNVEFLLLKVQRHLEAAIYKSSSQDKILRLGIPSRVKLDLEKHKNLIDLGFPVAKIPETGKYLDLDFYIEESLGGKLLGELFSEEHINSGVIGEDLFKKFLLMVEKFFRAQLQNVSDEKNWESVYESLHLQELLSELPQENDKILARLEMAKNRLNELPFTYLQGDFNPFNMLEGGVIDFETSFHGPLLADVVALPYYMEHFPYEGEEDVEVTRKYKWTELQEQKYYEVLKNLYENHGYTNFEKYIDDIKFLRCIWLAVRMHQWPKQQQYRYMKLRELM